MASIRKYNIKRATRIFAKKYKAARDSVSECSGEIQRTEKVISHIKELKIPSLSGNIEKSSSPIVIIEENAPLYSAPVSMKPSTSQSVSLTGGGEESVQPGFSSSGVFEGNAPPKEGASVSASAAAEGSGNKTRKTSFSNISSEKGTLEETVEGVDLKNLEVKTVRVRKCLTTDDFIKTDIKYPLTPPAPKQGEKVYAWTNIKWNAKSNGIVYNVVEPVLSAQDQAQIDKIKKVIEDEINVDFKSFSKESSTAYIQTMIENILKRFNMVVDSKKLDTYKYYIVRDFVGLGILQSLLNDPQIEDISCDGVGIPVYVYHRDSKLGSLRTNIIFDSHEKLDTIVMRIAQRCGRAISMAEPLLQGALPDGSRVQATLATDIASKGSNITIRRFLKEPLTPVHLLNYGTFDSRLLAYLWLAIENGKSIMIVGATASGKTSILNALSMFIKPSAKIVSIEDTPEIKLQHEHWVPEIARAGFGEAKASGQRRGEVSMFDLLKGSLRQRPDYIIVGEIRGDEASVFFQQIATGHPGLSTFHADSLQKVIDRLTTRPISLSKSLLETLDILIFAKRMKMDKGYVRKISELQEIVSYDSDRDRLVTNKLFELNAFSNTLSVASDSYIIGKISSETGLSVNLIKDQLRQRMKVLEWMADKYITDYRRVGEVFKSYYNDTNTLMDLIGEDYGTEGS